jgi:hypothetical protein
LIELLNCGADIESVDDQDATALLFACLQQSDNPASNINAVNELLERGANPDHAATKSSKFRAIHIAARDGQAALVRILLEAGASVDARVEKPDWDTPLHLSVRWTESGTDDEAVEVVRVLLDFGANINAARGDGSTALHLALDKTELNKDMIQVLVKFGADIDKVDGSDRSALYYAVSKHDKDVVNMLWNPDGYFKASVLFEAAAGGDAERVRQLLSANYDRTEKDDWNRTAYDVASSAELRSLLGPPLVMSNDSPGDSSEAGTMQATEQELCPLLRGDENYNSFIRWSCDTCGHHLEEVIFYRESYIFYLSRPKFLTLRSDE